MIGDVSLFDMKASVKHIITIGIAVIALTRGSMRAIEVCQKVRQVSIVICNQCNMQVHMLELWSVYERSHGPSMLVPCKKHPCNSTIKCDAVTGSIITAKLSRSKKVKVRAR